MRFDVAVDVGGTFTDVVVRERDAGMHLFKSPTTPDDILEGVFGGLERAGRALGIDGGALLAECADFAFGTTLATNAILEGKVAKTGMICTEGFRETLLIREGGKHDSYNMYVDYPPPYIPRYLTLGVRERVNAEGGVEVPLDEASARQALAQLGAWNVEAVGVCLLWSFVNPAHEARIGELVEEVLPGIPFSLSHRVHPTLREYRRASATAIDASLKPIATRSIGEVESRLKARGFRGRLTFVTSNGGRASTDDVVRRPIYLCMSGPSAAPVAATVLARREEIGRNLITIDMGGTSFDVSVTIDGRTTTHREGTIAGHTFGVPSVEVVTIAAGGGSIALVDAGGFIHVGPESAGARPGPACYGLGGTVATVTDANLVRGMLNPDNFADGSIKLRRDAAVRAIEEQVAVPLGLDVDAAASLICLTAEQHMAGAIEDLAIRRGIDLRNFVLVAGGAAAGLHAASLARELNIARVMVPRAAGVLSAFGIACGDIKFDFARAHFTSSAKFDFDGVAGVMAALEADARTFLDRMGVPEEQRERVTTVEARYAGQVWQITLPVSGRVAARRDLAALVETFHALHEQLYSVRAPSDVVEFIEWNMQALGRNEQPIGAGPTEAGATPEPKARRRVFLDRESGTVDIPVHDRRELPSGASICGPALIEEPLTVTFVPPGTLAALSPDGNIIITCR